MNRLEYVDLFQYEANEYLEVLNRCALRLEKEPDHKESLQEAFRVVHSLKGMTGTMGYQQMMRVTHCLENLLEDLKSGAVESSPAVMDILFEALDLLQAMLSNPEEKLEGTEEILEKISRVHSSSEAGEKCAPEDFAGVEIRLSEAEKEAVRLAKENKMRLHLVAVTLVEYAPLKSVRVYMLRQKLAAHGEIIAAVPNLQDLEDERFDRYFMLLLAAPQPLDDRILEELSNITDVEKVQLLPWKESLLESAPGLTPAAQKIETAGSTDHDIAEKMVRVETAKLDELVNLVGEMVVARTRVLQLGKGHSEELDSLLDQLKRSITNLQDTAMKLRMVPVKQVFDRFPRMVRDISRSRGKEVRLTISGEQTELDRTIINRLSDPLVHLLRNAIDHGIEPAAEREAQGKDPEGSILLQAYHEGNHIVIVVEDDGAGIDLEAIKKSALQKGIICQEEAALMSEQELLDLIFCSGFSTSTRVTDISGRGVGLDAVKSSIEALHGTIQVKSVFSRMTRFTLRLPLTLSIINSLLVKSSGQILAIPIEVIQENIVLDNSEIKTIRGCKVINLRGEVLSLYHLGERLGFIQNIEELSGYPVVIVEAGGEKAGLIVEQLIGQQEIMIKPLSPALKGLAGIAGATILGDGSISLIVDIPELLNVGR